MLIFPNTERNQMHSVTFFPHCGTRLKSSTIFYSTAFLDPEWFTFETAGTMVVGMDGGPARVQKTTMGRSASPTKNLLIPAPPPGVREASRKLERENTRTSGIERAAAAATGMTRINFPVKV